MNTSALEAVKREVSEPEEALVYLQELDQQLRVYHGRRNDA